MPLTLSKAQARRFLLAHQGLGQPYEFQGKDGVLDYIRRVGCIQFDPLDMVGKNPELVLQARVEGFQPGMLGELLYEDRRLLDGWDKLMSIYAVEDWPNFRRRREAARNGLGKSEEEVRAVLAEVRSAFEQRGPLSSIELEMGEMVDWFWTDTRLARAALESMFFKGELVVHHRVHTRKVYDLAHRCLPEALLRAPDPNESEEQYHDWYVQRRIGSVGLLWNRSGEAWLGMSEIKSKERKAVLERLQEAGEVCQAQIEGIAEPFYFRKQDEPRLQQSLEMNTHPPRAVVMAPLDNLMWDRRLLRELFDFDYTWEVYVPAAKRRYGYYVLPVLYGDRFIARFEPVRDKGRGVLTIKNWWWEPGITPTGEIKSELAACFRRFLHYLGASQLEISPGSREAAGLGWLEGRRL
jgi:uncharacterized protein YcaQ